jgi:8-oxo-dGTP pyrophosphatase MutT (NUDIX family)
VRFDEVAARLVSLPEPLPAPADILMPVVVGSRELQPRFRRPDGPARAAAVLALVYPDPFDDARLVLIERTTHDGHHSGEVSFPGGKAEPDDRADPVATALREAAEEVGLDAEVAGVRVVGLLDPLWIPVSDFEVTPVVALATRPPVMAPDPREVARIVEPRVDHFLPGAPVQLMERTIDGWPLRYGQYVVEDLAVWGATARILSQLGAVLADR